MNPLLPSECVSDAPSIRAVSTPSTAQVGTLRRNPLPLGTTWIEEEQAFNFAVCAEHAESVAPAPLFPARFGEPEFLTLHFDSLHNKSGRIWHCRIPLNQVGDARYYAYSVSGHAVAGLNGFDHEKALLDPYAKGVFFPPGFDRKLAMKPGPNDEKAPLGVLPRQNVAFDWSGEAPPRPESDAIICELHVKGFTPNIPIPEYIHPEPEPTQA